MVETLEFLQNQADKGSMPLFLRSHPYAKDRVVAVKKEIETVRSKYGR